MADNDLLSLLQQNNPFISSASPLPWDNRNPDFVSLNREASEEIEHLMLAKRRNPNLPLSGLILGESGSGKTHMLTRILRRLRSNGVFAVFVTVKTFLDPETVTQHVLSEIFTSLKQRHSHGRTQFDILMSQFMDSYAEHRRSDEFSVPENADPRIYLAQDIPDLDRKFLKGLMCYVNTSDPFKRLDIIDWLSRGLDDEEAMQLELPTKPVMSPESIGNARCEQEAEKTLINLGLVLAYSRVLMIVCFDQLDGMKDKDLITSWGNIVNLLMNDLYGVLPLYFMKADIWNRIISPVLGDYVSQRLVNNKIYLKACTVEQAQQLIFTKIKFAFEDEKTVNELYKWLMRQLKNSIKPGYSPRDVIRLANNAIKTGEPTDVIKEVYEEEYKKIQEEADSWPPNAEQLTLALKVWLESRGDVEFLESRKRHLKLSGNFNNKTKFAFVIVALRNNTSAFTGARNANKFLDENPESFVCYITEKQVYRDTWKRASEQLETLESNGGHVIMLDENSRVKWYALTSLINRVDNGDISLRDRNATRDDIKDFVSNIKLLELTPAKPKNQSPQQQPLFQLSTDVTRALIEIINSSPMGIIGMSKITKLMRERNFNLDPEQISNFIQKKQDIFKVFESKDNGLLVSFAKKS